MRYKITFFMIVHRILCPRKDMAIFMADTILGYSLLNDRNETNKTEILSDKPLRINQCGMMSISNSSFESNRPQRKDYTIIYISTGEAEVGLKTKCMLPKAEIYFYLSPVLRLNTIFLPILSIITFISAEKLPSNCFRNVLFIILEYIIWVLFLSSILSYQNCVLSLFIEIFIPNFKLTDILFSFWVQLEENYRI